MVFSTKNSLLDLIPVNTRYEFYQNSPISNRKNNIKKVDSKNKKNFICLQVPVVIFRPDYTPSTEEEMDCLPSSISEE